MAWWCVGGCCQMLIYSGEHLASLYAWLRRSSFVCESLTTRVAWIPVGRLLSMSTSRACLYFLRFLH
jgi:hypothetical protein